MRRRRTHPFPIALAATVLGCAEPPSGPDRPSTMGSVSAKTKDEWPAITVRINDDQYPAIASDGGGAYVNGTDGVYSVLQGSVIGDWVLDLSGRGTTRRLRLDLSKPLAGNTGAAPFSSATVQPRMIALGSVQNSGSFYNMNTSDKRTLDSPLSMTFNYNGVGYALRMNARSIPGTNWVSVVCTAENAAMQCAQWELRPSGVYGGETKNVAVLERVTTRGNVTLGFFYVTFHLSLSR